MDTKLSRYLLLVAFYVAALFAFAFTPRVSAVQTGDEINCRAAAKGLAWLKTQQHADGSFVDEVNVPSPANGWFFTVDALLAILSAGQDPSTYSQGGNTPITFLEKQVPENFYGLNNAGYALLASTMMEKQGYGPFSKRDALVSFINSHYDPQVGHYGGEHGIYGRNPHIHAYAVMGLASIEPVPRQAVTYIETTQKDDGGWGWTRSPSDVESTALAVQALVAAGGAKQEVLDKAHAYLLSQQNPDGGYPVHKGGEYPFRSETRYTAFAVQALLALGADSELDAPLRFLRSLQEPNGAFRYAPGGSDGDGYSTIAAVPALLKVSFASPYPTGICAEQAVTGMPGAGVSMDGATAWWVLVGALALGLGAAIHYQARRISC